MALLDELTAQVKEIFVKGWETREGRQVPSPSDLKLGNDAIEFGRATVLYADLSGSTSMVNQQGWQFSAEVYKTFLICSARLIKAEGGQITSYDGDRVMGIFIGNAQSTNAVRCALKINFAVQKIINPTLESQYSTSSYTVRQVVGIDTSGIRAARTGVRGDNDIVWVGRAANFAAKLTELNLEQRTWITEDVYNIMMDDTKLGGKENMWKKFNWTQNDDFPIYGSTWRWPV
jgi:class 3 adenylate cyclase